MFDFLFSLLTVDTAGWGASEGPRVVDLSAPEMFFLAKLFLNGKVTELGSPPTHWYEQDICYSWGFPFLCCVALTYPFSRLF